jgi:hypothetical protein
MSADIVQSPRALKLTAQFPSCAVIRERSAALHWNAGGEAKWNKEIPNRKRASLC